MVLRVPTLPLLSLFLLACGASTHAPQSAEAPAHEATFPSAAELDELAQVPPERLPEGGVEVPSWTLLGPFPDAIEARATTPPAPWASLLEAAPGGAAITEDMACVARELGRFYLEQQQAPTELLRRFVAGWCGVPALSVDVQFLGGEAPAQVDDAAVFAGWKDKARELVARKAGGERYAGLWFGRAQGRAVLAVVSSVPAVQLERTALAPDAEGAVLLRGQLLVPTAKLDVRVNRGALGVAECELDRRVALPAFAARCLVDAADASAWIELSAYAPGRVLGEARLRVLARRPDARPAYALADARPDTASAPTSLFALVNEARHAAGLPPLTLAPGESARATRLVPVYFADLLGAGGGKRADRIALGLIAGWDVAAKVASGSIYSLSVRSPDPRHLMAACLDSPSGRAVLLDPKATTLALGSLAGADPALSAGLFVTYETLPEAEGSDAARGFELVRQARIARGLAEPKRLDGLDDKLTRLGARLRAGEITPQDAVDSLLAATIRATIESNAHGWVAQGATLTGLALPDELFAPGEPSVAALAAPYRAPGEPWWQWVAVVVTADPQP